jgi:hypothetical protein
MVHSRNGVWIINTLSISITGSGRMASRALASKVLIDTCREMETRTEFLQLVSAVIVRSVGVGVMTATVLLGVAALLQ